MNWQRGLAIGFAAVIWLMVLRAGTGLHQGVQNEQRLSRTVDNHLARLGHSTAMHWNARERTLTLQRMPRSEAPFARDDLQTAFRRFGSAVIEARTALLQMERPDRERAPLERQGRLTSATVPLQQQVPNSFKALQRASVHQAAAEATELQARARPLSLGISAITVAISLLVAIAAIRQVRTATSEREHPATHDALTGLPNRMLLLERLDRELRRDRRRENSTGVLFIDREGFEMVNDAMGHAVGDELLCQVATRLCNAVRDTDTVARPGGDEFVVLPGDARGMADIRGSAERVLSCLGEVFHLPRGDIFSGASIGVSVHPEHGDHPDELLEQADTALYAAMGAGRGT